MRVRRTTGESMSPEEHLDRSFGGEATDEAPDPATVGSHTAEYMDYLSDMVLELRAMAERGNAPTLAGILDLAYREARQQLIARTRR